MQTKKKKKTAKGVLKKSSHLRKSKTENFLQNLQTNNSMIEYITNLRIMNPAAQLPASANEPRREGGFVRLAHARDEFTAPILTKGKSALSRMKAQSKKKNAKRTKSKNEISK